MKLFTEEQRTQCARRAQASRVEPPGDFHGGGRNHACHGMADNQIGRDGQGRAAELPRGEVRRGKPPSHDGIIHHGIAADFGSAA